MADRRRLVAALSLLLLAGCGSDVLEPDVDLGLWGSVVFTFTGVDVGLFRAERVWDGDRTKRPYAVAAPVRQDGIDEAVRILTSSADSISLSLVLFHLPGPGTASITQTVNGTICSETSPCARSFFVNLFEDGSPWIFVMLEGEVEVFERTETRIEGRFDMEGVTLAEELAGVTDPSAFLSGTFDLPVTLLGCDDSACDN